MMYVFSTWPHTGYISHTVFFKWFFNKGHREGVCKKGEKERVRRLISSTKERECVCVYEIAYAKYADQFSFPAFLQIKGIINW